MRTSAFNLLRLIYETVVFHHKYRGTMNLKKVLFYFLLITLVSFSSIKYTTGPSIIESIIQPISINEKGEILCKTRFTKNEMGAYSEMKIEYGFCIISNGTIIEFKTKVIEATPDPSYYEQKNYWDEVFKSKTNQKQLNEIKKDILKNEYDFHLINVAPFKIDKILSILNFEKTKKISLKNIKQKGLHNALSKKYFNDKKVRLLYDFGNILIFDNTNDIDNNALELEIGADFDYYNSYNTMVNDKGDKISLGFDISKVTGVIFLK
ncbi:hypothetical protein [Flavivirga algicola]|uniref:Uncharacterized protein n=1 Tax=Flavivirga algicola TaxID=2729136 RepID=A0ABX1RUY1_9FLAO|nr:hypothetical protein [Flavivirga algicola]NMH87356.1 hypothetical protein [Flavivirga algicola]